jgi:putative acetyltransferase
VVEFAAVYLVIAVDDPRAADVRALLGRHLAFAHTTSPSEHVHALDVDSLAGPTVTFLSARRDGVLLGVGALKELDARHGEIKSMHTAAEARGAGVGRAVLRRLLDLAADRGYRRVSLETGTMDAFAPARALYESYGFRPCAPFAQYTVNPYSYCMSPDLAPGA